jgi:hypothetical protein
LQEIAGDEINIAIKLASAASDADDPESMFHRMIACICSSRAREMDPSLRLAIEEIRGQSDEHNEDEN